MKRKRLLSILTAAVMTFFLLAPAVLSGPKAQAANSQKWNVERYGDRIDIDAKLNQMEKDPAFMQDAEAKIKEQASKINFDKTTVANGLTGYSDSTYDGGTKKDFYTFDLPNEALKRKTFTRRSVGENVEIWVADDLSFPPGDPRPTPVITQEQVDNLRDEFDKNIYPKDTAFFGTPDTLDGSNSLLVDWGVFPEGYYGGSSKVIMLVDNIMDENYYDPKYPFFVAGFYSGTLEAYADRNIITIDTNSWETRLENTFYPTVMHELQHLIHADNDPAEESWINEGMSTFAEFLGGYGHDAGSINFYLDHPENSLVKWDDHYSAVTGPETIADYGQVYLFTLYMNDKLGREFIRDLALNKKQGIESINEVLKAHKSKLDFTQLYQNFITALVLDSRSAGNGIYKFDSINLRDLPIDKEGTKRNMTVDFEKAVTYEKEGVPAWGGDFKALDFKDKIRNISFDGVDFVPVKWLSVDDPLGSDNQVLWGNKGDEIDNALIFEADLSNFKTATLKFDNYIDIEEQWDFGVVQVSTDGGHTWKSLSNKNTRADLVDEGYPKIRENLPGFTGAYEGWQKETFDLSPYSGEKILVSFRYLTDWAGNNAGWYIDNIEIPEIGFKNDCSSTKAFKSMNEILKDQYVNYTVTFINEKEVGNKKGRKTDYKVITVDPFTATEKDALTLRQLFQDGKNYMITTYAAPIGDKDPVDFTYEIILKNAKKPKK